MVDSITLNARKPKDDASGHAMLNRMNEHHRALHKWALEHVSIDAARQILDIGYGGGQNIRNMTKIAPNAKIFGIDYSEASYKKCAELNREAIEEGIVSIETGSAELLPYSKESFELVTAFETIYYWPNIQQCFQNVYHVLRDRGALLICNEDRRRSGNEEIADLLNMQFYDEKELKDLLYQAGFRTVHTYLHPNSSWICAVGRK